MNRCTPKMVPNPESLFIFEFISFNFMIAVEFSQYFKSHSADVIHYSSTDVNIA